MDSYICICYLFWRGGSPLFFFDFLFFYSDTICK